MQSLRIIDWDFVRYGELALYTSLQITRRHFGTGEFELHISADAPHVGELRTDRLLLPTDEPDKAMLIEAIIREDAKHAITVKGCTLDGLVRRRLAVPPRQADQSFGWDRITADAESCYQHFVAGNLIAPEDEKRAIPRLVLAENLHRGMTVPWQARFDQMDALLKELGEYSDMGYSITPDLANQRFLFSAAPGRDLTVGNGGDTHVILSVGNGNASEMRHTLDRAALKNTAYVGGYGEDEQRLILAVGTDFTGLNRRETWVDGGSLETPQELDTAGKRKLTQAEEKNTIQGTVMRRGVFRYGVDWDLGDKVTLLAASGRVDARCVEVKETYEQGKPPQLAAVFGDAPVSITTVIRKMTDQIVR